MLPIEPYRIVKRIFDMRSKEDLRKEFEWVERTIRSYCSSYEITVGYEDYDTKIWYLVRDPATSVRFVFRPIIENWFAQVTSPVDKESSIFDYFGSNVYKATERDLLGAIDEFLEAVIYADRT